MKERERLAWTILLVSSGIFVALLIGVPLGIYQWIQHSTVAPTVRLQALQGTAQIRPPDDKPSLLLAQQEPLAILPGTIIINDADAETLLTVDSPDGQFSLATAQIYPNTELEVSIAKSPRYQASNQEHRIEIRVTTGRVRLGLSQETGNPADFRAHTPHAQILLWEAGSYSLDVSNQQSQITVREGKAVIFAPGGQLTVEEAQRGAVGVSGAPEGPLRPERDLITNGHFRQPLEQGWQISRDTADSSQPAGEVEIITSSGQNVVHLFRAGSGHAQTGVYQLLNQSLRDYRTVQLHLSGQLNFQSLGVCGALGSECPLMVRIEYEDTDGRPQQWVQGFFYWVDPAAPNPFLCETCPPPRQEHEQHAQGTQFFYDSPNLIEVLAHDGAPPAKITSIAIYASGHSYDVQVGEAELLVSE